MATNAVKSRNERVYLTGFMGCGKSTIGPILANVLGFEFVDIDRAIEAETGKSVNDIFFEHGEEHFRTIERRLLTELSSRRNIVISLGGGTIVDPQAFNRITGSGIVVYLKTSPEQIFRRLHHKTDRPMLHDRNGELLDEEKLRRRIMELYAVREPLYAKADIIVPTGDMRVGIAVDEIVRKLSPLLK